MNIVLLRDSIRKAPLEKVVLCAISVLFIKSLQYFFELYLTPADDDYSGLFNNRPDFERLIEDAKLQKFDIVISKTQSRFTRNMEHMEKYLHNFFPLLGIRFIGVVDNTDTANRGNKKSRQINGFDK